jgi:hypothetical protein
LDTDDRGSRQGGRTKFTFELDEVQARELCRLRVEGVSVAAILERALTKFLAEQERAEHRRAVMEAILTGVPITAQAPPAGESPVAHSGNHNGTMTTKVQESESTETPGADRAGMNQHEGGDGRALHRRHSEPR